MVKRIVVGAHYGLKDWLAQRITAVVMAIYAILVAFGALRHGPFDYDAWRAFAAQGWMRFATFVFVIALGYHAWVGMRDIVMDYVKSTGIRLTLHAVVAVLLGWLFYREPFGVRESIAMAIIFLGVGLVKWQSRKASVPVMEVEA